MKDLITIEFNEHIKAVNLLHNLTEDVYEAAHLCIECLKKDGKIQVETPYQLESIEGKDNIKSVMIKNDNGANKKIKTDSSIIRHLIVKYKTLDTEKEYFKKEKRWKEKEKNLKKKAQVL